MRKICVKANIQRVSMLAAAALRGGGGHHELKTANA